MYTVQDRNFMHLIPGSRGSAEMQKALQLVVRRYNTTSSPK